MDMKTLTINQVQKILGWSYPTALQFAQENGELQNGGRLWCVPVDSVVKVIEEREADARNMRSNLTAAMMSNDSG